LLENKKGVRVKNREMTQEGVGFGHEEKMERRTCRSGRETAFL